MNNDKNKKVYKNHDIFPGKIRLIQKSGKPIVIDRDQAIVMAKESNEDLVQISYDKNSFPKAICKIMNYGKLLYENKKKEKEAARKSRLANAEAKEVYFSIRIDDGDKNTKVNHIREFLSEEHSSVKVCVKLSRREMNLLGMAKDLMHEILSHLEDVAEMDSEPSFNSGIMSCTLKPKKR